MALILALETSTEWCSVALLRGSDVAVRHERTGALSSQRILPMVGELLEEAGVTLASCQAIAFGAGPGAFTGLRTACGVAQGLAFGADLPVIAVDSLESCAEQVRESLPPACSVLVVVDARMDQVYWAEYRWLGVSQGWERLGPMQVSTPEAVLAQQPDYVLVGNAISVCGERLIASVGARAVFDGITPHARAVATIAQRAYAAGRVLSAADAAPVYVRDNVAQTVLERQALKQLVGSVV